MIHTNQTKEEQLKILQKEMLKAINSFQLLTYVLCCYLKVMIEYGLCKPNIYDYFTTFPVTDVLNECRIVVDQLPGNPLGKIIDLHQDAVEIDTFMETYLDLPIDEEPSYLNSIERQMNTARQGFNIVDFAYWWSVWNITKSRVAWTTHFGRLESDSLIKVYSALSRSSWISK